MKNIKDVPKFLIDLLKMTYDDSEEEIQEMIDLYNRTVVNILNFNYNSIYDSILYSLLIIGILTK